MGNRTAADAACTGPELDFSRADDGAGVKPTTGFEPTTLTLAKNGPTPLPAPSQLRAARSAISIDHKTPLLT